MEKIQKDVTFSKLPCPTKGNFLSEALVDTLSEEAWDCLAKKPIEIDCEEVWRQISNYLDDELDPGLRAVMAAHFKDCAHCSAVLDGARNVVKLVGDGRAFEVPAKANQKLYTKLNEHLAARRKN